MSVDSPLFQAIVRDFTASFGSPTRTSLGQCNWSLRRFSYISSVNILVSGSYGDTVVWVFDPHDPSNGSEPYALTHENQIAPLIQKIADQVRMSGKPLP